MWLIVVPSFIFSLIVFVYRFKHPEKTETQLFIDIITGKIFYEK